MPLQEWIHHWEEGAGSKALKVAVAILSFIALALIYDLFTLQGFTTEEAMENAQVARNLAAGKGFTTDSIRPLSLYLLNRSAPTGQSSKVLAQPVPDLTTPPVYPVLLAGLMKVAPLHFAADQVWVYSPERWINAFNQLLFFVAAALLFFLARRLFDTRVAWLSALLLVGTSLFWKFSVSGLPTLWLVVIFLAIVWCLVELEERERTAKAKGKSLALAALIGALLGLGGLSRYAFGWLIIPALFFVALSLARRKGLFCLLIAVSFLVVMGPWLTRNFVLSGNCFGTAAYTVLEDTPAFPGDTLERSSNPLSGFNRVEPLDVIDKLIDNTQDIFKNDLPQLGGNWISLFFLVGLLVPFRNPALKRVRYFLVGSLIVLIVAQALGKTHLSSVSPDITSENLLVILAPLIFAYGASLFYVLFDQLSFPALDARRLAVVVFVGILCAPLIFSISVTRSPPVDTPYSPLHVQQVTGMMHENELMMSDIPGAVAWYGNRSCAWLSLNDDDEFFKVNALKPVRGLFLTQVTSNEKYLSQMRSNPKGWGEFLLECAEHGEVPTGFPLRKAPMRFLPAQLFLSDQARWRGISK